MNKQMEKQNGRCAICDMKQKEANYNEMELDNGKAICPLCNLIITEIRAAHIHGYKIANHLRGE